MKPQLSDDEILFKVLKQLPEKKAKLFLRQRKFERMTDGFVRILIHSLPKVPFVAIAVSIYFLAGKKTIIKGLGDIISAFGILETTAYICAFVAVGLWLKELKYRKKLTAEFSKRIIELEKLIDPNRTSSNLTESGDTNFKDL